MSSAVSHKKHPHHSDSAKFIIGAVAATCVALIMAALVVEVQLSRQQITFYKSAIQYCIENDCHAEANGVSSSAVIEPVEPASNSTQVETSVNVVQPWYT